MIFNKRIWEKPVKIFVIVAILNINIFINLWNIKFSMRMARQSINKGDTIDRPHADNKQTMKDNWLTTYRQSTKIGDPTKIPDADNWQTMEDNRQTTYKQSNRPHADNWNTMEESVQNTYNQSTNIGDKINRPYANNARRLTNQIQTINKNRRHNWQTTCRQLRIMEENLQTTYKQSTNIRKTINRPDAENQQTMKDSWQTKYKQSTEIDRPHADNSQTMEDNWRKQTYKQSRNIWDTSNIPHADNPQATTDDWKTTY